MSSIRKWADEHQYDAAPQEHTTEDDGVQAGIRLINMNADPLGDMAWFSAIYSGQVLRDRSEVTDDMRKKILDDVQKTHLKAPLEIIKMHFLVEGVDRAFTHQHVRQRTAVYGQESMRFAVMGDLMDATTLPPELQGTKRSTPAEVRKLQPKDQFEENRETWDDTVRFINDAYHKLVQNGLPAEEARGLLPHATATRIHYATDMRNLSDHAGNRLCTQAQFHWRRVFVEIMLAIQNYTPDFSWVNDVVPPDRWDEEVAVHRWEAKFRWQFRALADSGLFRPVCYQLNYCPMQASFDRTCKFRDHVITRSDHGNKSEFWHLPFSYLEEVPVIPVYSEWGAADRGSEEVHARKVEVPSIQYSDWVADSWAARKEAR